MDNEIYQLVKHLSQRGLDNLTSEEKLIKLWQRAVKKWNKSHEPTYLTLEEVENAFKNKWPQIYGTTLNGILYLSFSYIDYYFTRNSKGQVCGGIWPRINEMPRFPVNMTAGQIVELAFWLRTVPYPCCVMNDHEKMLLQGKDVADSLIEDFHFGVNPYPTKQELLKQIVLNLQTVAYNQFFLGNFDESLNSLNSAMGYLQLCYAIDDPQKKESMENHLLEGELYTMMANDLRYLMKDLDAEVCLKCAYEKVLHIYEHPDWKERMYWYLSDDERAEIDQSQRCSYLNWAWNYATSYVTGGMPSEAITILEKAKAVAKDMNEIEKGRWTENLESIKNKLATIRENANK